VLLFGTAGWIVDYYCWLVWCERKILFWTEDTVHMNSARVRGLASTSQPASAVCGHNNQVIHYLSEKWGWTWVYLWLLACLRKIYGC